MAHKNQRLGAGEFKTHCLKIFEDIKKRRFSITITKHGKPIVRVIPYEEENAELFGCLRDTAVIHGDIVAATGEHWDAESDKEE